MLAKKCINTQKANQIIENFANSIVKLPTESFYEITTEEYNFIIIANPDQIENAIAEHNSLGGSQVINYEYKTVQPRFTILETDEKEEMDFSIMLILNENYCYEIYVPCWNIALQKDDDIGGKLFRKDIVKRSPMTKGFSDITLSILHEIGHAMTQNDSKFLKGVEEEDYWTEENIDIFSKEEIEYFGEELFYDERITMLYHYRFPNEILATDWAIKWLSNSENRKIAKQFEKNFFACFTKI